MTKLIHKTGDIFTTTSRAVGHGVNTHGLMGAGIARTFRTRYPKMYEAYHQECLLGKLPGGSVFPWREEYEDGTSFIFNIASQEKPGSNASYDHLVSGVKIALEWCDTWGVPVLALPRIGSGIGGLDEKVVEAILTALAEKSPVDIELWTYAAPTMPADGVGWAGTEATPGHPMNITQGR